jgi:hypothetical protein
VADRIVELEATVERQERILAALREPSEAVELAATHEYWATLKVSPPTPRAIRAAVAAAEQEVDHGTR